MATFQIQNAPDNVNLTNFRAYLGSTPLSKSARFIAAIIPTGNMLLGSTTPVGRSRRILNNLMFQCESTELPGRGFMNADFRYYGPSFKLPFQTSYEDIVLNFLCRDDFLEREFFDDWMDLINPPTNFDFQYRDDYSCNIQIYQYSEAERSSNDNRPVVQYAFTLRDAWPVLVNPQPVTWADDGFHRLSVTFTYTKWIRESQTLKKNDIVSGATILPEGTGKFFPKVR